MQLIVSSISTSIVNLIVFSLIPFVWWFFRHQKETGFFSWIGFYKPKLKSRWPVLIIFAVIYWFFYNFDYTRLINPETLAYLESSENVSANAFAGLGAAAIFPALIENFIANGVAEEILYRGFLCKRFCGKLGKTRGIVLQAVLFGLMHNALFLLAGLDVGLINKYYDLAQAGDELAKNHYANLAKKAGDCIQCGHCDHRCPFHVVQTNRMNEIRAYFSQ